MVEYYKINSENITYRIINDKAIILNLKTGKYYSLNESGTFSWSLLENKTSIDELVDRAVENFGIDKKEAIRDIKLLLKDLISERMVRQEK